jgi:hypothetical protein
MSIPENSYLETQNCRKGYQVLQNANFRILGPNYAVLPQSMQNRLSGKLSVFANPRICRQDRLMDRSRRNNKSKSMLIDQERRRPVFLNR